MSVERRSNKKGDVWVVRWRDPRSREMSFRLKKDAEQFERNIRAAKNAGLYRNPDLDKVTFGEQYKRWWKITEQSGLAPPNTVAQYENVGRLHVEEELGSHRVASLRRIDFDEWIARLVKKRLSASTIRTARTIAGSVMASAVDAGIVLSNPVRGLRVPKEQAQAKKALTSEQVERLVDHMPHHYRALVLVLAYGGLRPSEALALRRRHLDDFGQLTVEEGLTETRGKLIERPTTKTHKSRLVPLPASVATIVRGHMTASSERSPDSRIFLTEKSKQVRLSNFRKIMLEARDAAGLPKWVTPYTLRHTAASLLATGGVGVHAAAAILGNDPAVYLRTYAHLYPHDLRSAAGTLDRMRRSHDTDAENEGDAGSSIGSSPSAG
jgi:integrase